MKLEALIPGAKQTAMLLIQRLVEEFNIEPRLNSVELNSYYENAVHNITFEIETENKVINGHIDFWFSTVVTKGIAFMWRVGSSTNTHPYQGRIDRSELLSIDALIASMKTCPFLKQDK